ncbi:MAG: MFS transporter [Chlamydiae bacterium]|nr:MFS transporter [Chlamydiota bacterium]
MVFVLNVIGYSVVIPLFQSPNFPLFFDLIQNRPLTLGGVIGVYGLGQFLGILLCKKLEYHIRSRSVILGTSILFLLGHLIMVWGLFQTSFPIIFLGRVLSGLGSGNIRMVLERLIQSEAFDFHPQVAPILSFGSALSLFLGPWVGASLGEIEALKGGGGFIAVAIITLINILFLHLFLEKHPDKKGKEPFWIHLIKEIFLVFLVHHHRKAIYHFALFFAGWLLCLIAFPYFFGTVYKVAYKGIGDIFSYLFVTWFFGLVFLNPELLGKFSKKRLAYIAIWGLVIGMLLSFFAPKVWLFWILIPLIGFCGAIAFSNIDEITPHSFLLKLELPVLGVLIYAVTWIELFTPILATFYQVQEPGIGLFLSATLFFILAWFLSFFDLNRLYVHRSR